MYAQNIVGAWVESVEVSDDKETLTFHLIGGHKATFTAYGDCCSSTWIEDLTVPVDVSGCQIIDVKEHDMGDVVSKDEGEFIQSYQTSFVTPRGEILVEYRNSSNGYYGGSLEGPSFS